MRKSIETLLSFSRTNEKITYYMNVYYGNE